MVRCHVIHALDNAISSYFSFFSFFLYLFSSLFPDLRSNSLRSVEVVSNPVIDVLDCLANEESRPALWPSCWKSCNCKKKKWLALFLSSLNAQYSEYIFFSNDIVIPKSKTLHSQTAAWGLIQNVLASTYCTCISQVRTVSAANKICPWHLAYAQLFFDILDT